MRISDWSSDVCSSELPVVTLSDARTTTVVNARITPTPAFQRNPERILDQSLIVGRLQKLSSALQGIDATGLGLALLGDPIAANPFIMGYAAHTRLLLGSPCSMPTAVHAHRVSCVRHNPTTWS